MDANPVHAGPRSFEQRSGSSTLAATSWRRCAKLQPRCGQQPPEPTSNDKDIDLVVDRTPVWRAAIRIDEQMLESVGHVAAAAVGVAFGKPTVAFLPITRPERLQVEIYVGDAAVGQLVFLASRSQALNMPSISRLMF